MYGIFIEAGYIQHPLHYDSNGHDLVQGVNCSLEQCAYMCNDRSDCVGFMYIAEFSMGFLKYQLAPLTYVPHKIQLYEKGKLSAFITSFPLGCIS